MSDVLDQERSATTPTHQLGPRLVERIVSPHPPDFAILCRQEGGQCERVDLFVGRATRCTRIDDIPVANHAVSRAGAVFDHPTLVMVPYRQVVERGYRANDDGLPIVALEVSEQETMDKSRLFDLLPTGEIHVTGSRFSLSDREYETLAQAVIDNEIGAGEGANFVIRRDLLVDIDNYSPAVGLSLFRRLLEQESGTYWTFIVYCDGRTLVGATPEKHVSVSSGTVTMNPISGTYRYPSGGPTIQGIAEFLADTKETDELYMVVDEELKMMARICEEGGKISGPRLKEMAKLAHVEYFIQGQTCKDAREILRETMFAPTVMGSPLENSARVIEKYEPDGRGYYSGVIALIGRDANGDALLDSAIVLRTADIDNKGHARIGVGATLVRHSDPATEAQETRAKAAALLNAFEPQHEGGFAGNPAIRTALAERNRRVAPFWLSDSPPAHRPRRSRPLHGLMVDAEDTFTAMLRHHLRAQGVKIDVLRYDQQLDMNGYDLVVLGPGPGDPNDDQDFKIRCLRSTVKGILDLRTPLIAVCLSHQVLCTELGIRVVKRSAPNQGVQKVINLFGSREAVGFYNSFSGVAREDGMEVPGFGKIELCRDRQSDEVHALRGPSFVSMQFHPESLLTLHGDRILSASLVWVCGR
jgi:phenazine biosynthesis protein phzE